MTGTISDPDDSCPPSSDGVDPCEAELERWLADTNGFSLRDWRVREAMRKAKERASGIIPVLDGVGPLHGRDAERFRRMLIRYSVLSTLGRRSTADAMMAQFERRLHRELRDRRLARLRRRVLSGCRRTRTRRPTRRTTTRAHRTTTKKAAATSTGDPDPESSSGARAGVRSVAVSETALVGGGL